MALFVAGAVAGRAVLAVAADPPAYPAAVAATHDADEAPGEPHTWLVDGFNLMHAAVLKGRDRREWWRAEARARVLELVRGLDAPGAEVIVVFDGRREPDEPDADDPPGPRVVFAASADEWMVAAVRRAADPSRIAVVTADRQVAERARHRGARVIGPTRFARLCVGDT